MWSFGCIIAEICTGKKLFSNSFSVENEIKKCKYTLNNIMNIDIKELIEKTVVANESKRITLNEAVSSLEALCKKYAV